MKKRFLSLVCATLATMLTSIIFISGCFFGGNNNSEFYTISYVDDSGIHQISVMQGMPYFLNEIPERNGYVFVGLFDAENGGTQYVSASGTSLSTFMEGKNIVLFPQYKAKDYIVILDYQGAEITGSRQITVSYNSSLPELPNNVTIEHKDFIGWFTQANCEGTQITDKYGLIHNVSVVNDINFDLSSDYIYLYAGFETEKHTVSFYFGADIDYEEIQVPYNTPINEVVTTTRVNGNAVLSWSTTKDGAVFNGKITEDMVLYAKEYAPVIDFDSNGGTNVKAIVARAGEVISLPIPQKELSEFDCWIDQRGQNFTQTVMPEESLKLQAVWRNKIVFNSNGGSDVDDISGLSGNTLILPQPVRSGYVFAGWFKDDGKIFEAHTIPDTGVLLKAGWYQTLIVNKTYVTNSATGGQYDYANGSTLKEKFYNIDLSGYITSERTAKIKLKLTFESSTTTLGKSNLLVNFYSKIDVNPMVKLCDVSRIVHNNTDFVSHEIIKEFELNETLFYMGFSCETQTFANVVRFKNVKIEVEIPDLKNLIL